MPKGKANQVYILPLRDSIHTMVRLDTPGTPSIIITYVPSMATTPLKQQLTLTTTTANHITTTTNTTTITMAIHIRFNTAFAHHLPQAQPPLLTR